MKCRPEYDPKVIGKNLKRLREAKNLSVNEVREYLHVSKQAVYNYESGKRYPQSDTMFALMELYEADLHDIIDEYKETYFHEPDRIFQYQGMEIVVTNANSLDERKKKYSELLREYYKAG